MFSFFYYGFCLPHWQKQYIPVHRKNQSINTSISMFFHFSLSLLHKFHFANVFITHKVYKRKPRICYFCHIIFDLPLPLFVFRTSHILPRGNKKRGDSCPASLKEKATDATFLLTLKSQYRLPINLFWGRCSGKPRSFIGETVRLPDAFPRDGNALILSNRKTIVRPYLRQPLFNLCTRTSKERWRNRVHTAVVRPGKLRSFIGETVCLPEAFPRDGNARFFEKRIALVSTVGGANAVKAPSSLKVKATDALFFLV